jgi:hypothetical protein
MPILSRFVPRSTTLQVMARERYDPERAPRLARYCLIRRLAHSFMMALPAIFLGELLLGVQLRVIYHLSIPLVFWIREPVMLALTSWLAYEMFHVERCYRRYGL